MPQTFEIALVLVGGQKPASQALRDHLREGFPTLRLHEATSESALRELVLAHRPMVLLCDLSSAIPLESVARVLRDLKAPSRIVALADPEAGIDIVSPMTRGARDLVTHKDPLHLQLVLARELDMLADWCEANTHLFQRRVEREPVAHFQGEEVIWATESFARLLGRTSAAQVARKAFWVCIDGDDHHALRRGLAAAATAAPGGAPAQLPVRAVGTDGRRLKLVLSLAPERSAERTVVRVKASEADSAVAQHFSDTRGHINVEMLKRLRTAISGNRLALAVQPISVLAGPDRGEERKLDVLIRIKDDNGELTAADFLREARAAGLLKPLDHWVVRNACAVYARNAGKRDVLFFLRLSRQTLQDPLTLTVVREAIAQYKANPANLSFELTEAEYNALQDDEHKILLALKGDGCRLTLSQFGNQKNSLETLRTLPLDFIKLDLKITADVARSDAAREQLRQILDLAATRQVGTISTRVSDAMSLAELWRMGVNFVQGYYVHEPEIVVGT